MNAGTCRQSSASLQTTLAVPVAGCPGLFGDLGLGGIGAYKTNYPTSGGVQFSVVVAGGPSGVDAVAGQEYFLATLRINHAKTVGTGACGGCVEPMCLGVGYLQLTSSSSPVPTFPIQTFPIDEGHLVSWQNGSPGAVYAWQVDPPLGHELDYAMTCDFATAARRSTWRAVKSLYR